MREIYSQICRLCLQMTSDLLPIYGEGSCDNISETIMACTVIKMTKDDGYPENICHSCIKRLNNAFEFKQLCENSDDFLRNYDSKHETHQKQNETLSDNKSVESNNLISLKNDPDHNVTEAPIPEEFVESIICKEEDNSLDENDQFEIVFSYPETKLEEMYQECVKDKSEIDELKKEISVKTSKILRKKSQIHGKSKTKSKVKDIPENGPHNCKICNKEFNSLTGLKNHERSHKFEKNTQCSVCHKVFSHAGNMRRHALIHQGIKPHVCHLCGKKFSRSSTLKDHVDIHHARNLKQYSCTLCDYTNARRNALQVHMVVKHQSGSLSKAKPRFTKPKPRSCEICNKTLSSTAALNMHMKIHNNIREHLCRHCGRAFHHKAGLENHERIHTGEKPYVCPHCPKRFSQQIGLRIHVRTHTGERPYQCKLCLKTFSQQTHLRTHSFTHSGERRYACEVCNKRFALREGLRYHQMAHTGETPFKCVMCNRGFYIQYKLKVHMAKSHGIAMEIIKK